ncbi:tandem-95 repeat protein [Paenibacillus pinisoli]|uniref:Tandem-95 repeat protein n=1 Tax=Paenibacillus pinisoli TaxID=1276110 RepID=A0A3A6PLT4_9BACL|nr:putative Ig domain-containing protein [Paenibacillus pinisoli]RJX37043.1 tandem-95 repeat protein [Paenibacillus pinisoli]
MKKTRAFSLSLLLTFSLFPVATSATATELSIQTKDVALDTFRYPIDVSSLKISGNLGADGIVIFPVSSDLIYDATIFEPRLEIEYSAANTAPVLAAIGNKTVNEESLLTFTASASDAQGDPLTYSLVGAPLGATINATTGVFTWAPMEAQGPGSYTFSVRVSDGALSDEEEITVTVNEVNVAPVLAAIGNKTVDEENLLTFTAVATDVDIPANTLTYSLVGAPLGATINATTGVFTWAPMEAQGPGSYTFSVRVSDGALSDEEEITITVNEVNVAPVLAAIGNKTVDEANLLTFTAVATDVDIPANTLTYSLVGAPVGATINATTGVFTWGPTEAQGPGIYTFTVRVSDGMASDQETITVTVNEVNSAPVLAPIGNKTVDEEMLLTFIATAIDSDSVVLTYSLVGAPAGATINAATGEFTWTPTEAQGSGSYTFTVRVSDGMLSDEEEITVTVNEVNVAPVLAAIGNKTVDEANLLTFTAVATDIDIPANTLTYSLVGAPVGASIHASTGVFVWTPTKAQGPGSYNFTVQVSDGSLTDEEVITVTVKAVHGNPGTVPGYGEGTNPAPEPTPEPTTPPTSIFNTNLIQWEQLQQLIRERLKSVDANEDWFTDTRTHWARQTIDKLASLRVITGYVDGSFNPNNSITRAEFAAVLARLFIFAPAQTSPAPFTDMQGHWAQGAVTELANHGIITGHSDGSFRPNATITKEEMVVMMMRLVNTAALPQTGHADFEDMATAGKYAQEEIDAAAKAGLIQGYNDKLQPKGKATRAEAVTMLWKLLMLDPELKAILDDSLVG